MIVNFAIYNLQFSFNLQFTIFQVARTEAAHWKLVIENSLKLENCKLKIAPGGSY
jgi:hypothetical protein